MKIEPELLDSYARVEFFERQFERAEKPMRSRLPEGFMKSVTEKRERGEAEDDARQAKSREKRESRRAMQKKSRRANRK